MATTKNTRYVASEQQEEYEEVVEYAYSDEQTGDDEASLEPRCSACGELLAWHEEFCSSVAQKQPSEDVEPVAEVVAVAKAYHYDLGQRVQPALGAPARTVVWRGQLKERHPETGLVQRVPVYRLDDGYWDCYREEELQAA